jgi:hypothetical protein
MLTLPLQDGKALLLFLIVVEIALKEYFKLLRIIVKLSPDWYSKQQMTSFLKKDNYVEVEWMVHGQKGAVSDLRHYICE